MATVTRRVGTEIATEHISRVGRTGDTSYTARANHFVKAAYLYCATRFHHHVFDGIDTASLSAGDSTVDLSALFSSTTPLAVFAVRLLDGTRTVRFLEFLEAHQLFSRMASAPAEPKNWTRFANTVYLDAGVEDAFTASVLAYKTPTDWDLDNASPLDEHWDEAILVKSVELAFRATHQYDVAQVYQQHFDELARSTGQPLIAEGRVVHDPRVPDAQAHGGARG